MLQSQHERDERLRCQRYCQNGLLNKLLQLNPLYGSTLKDCTYFRLDLQITTS